MTPDILTLAAGVACAVALAALARKRGGGEPEGRIGIGFGLASLARRLTGRSIPLAGLALISCAGMGVGLLTLFAGGAG